jgi:hypothetical protein
MKYLYGVLVLKINYCVLLRYCSFYGGQGFTRPFEDVDFVVTASSLNTDTAHVILDQFHTFLLNWTL